MSDKPRLKKKETAKGAGLQRIRKILTLRGWVDDRNGGRKGSQARKRERRAYQKSFTRQGWIELKAHARREDRRETNGAFGGEDKKRKAS